MRKIQLALCILLTAVVLPCLAPAASAPKSAKSSHSVSAILITASNQKGGVDRKLEAYGAELRRNLPFDTFRFVSEGTASLPEGGRGTVTFAGGHRLELEDEPGDGIRLKVYWMTGSEVVISTTLTLNPGIPGVLVRRGAKDGDVPVVLLVAR
jgi:hypothetical protein